MRTLSALLILVLAQSAGYAADPPFTKEQAVEGRKAYRQHCASCHGAKLEGEQLAPAMVGERFDVMWRGKSTEILASHLLRMPPEPQGVPGSLGEETYANILAYILKSNGLKEGENALPKDVYRLAHLIIPQIPGKEIDYNKPIPGGVDSPLLSALPDVTPEMLKNPSPNDWLHWGQNYQAFSFSALNQINRENVGNLKTIWRRPLRFGGNIPMPLVHQGVMYMHTFPDTVLAIDASNGSILWRYEHQSSKGNNKKLGLALYGNKVLVPTTDLHVLALNARNGELIWDHKIAGTEGMSRLGGYQLRSSPLVVGDSVVQGVTASGVPKGGFILAMDLNTGEEKWRFNTIARPGEPFGNTWNGLSLEERSGGSVWHQGSYDPELNLIYYGIAPTYDTGPLLHPIDDTTVNSDAMYTNCTVALNGDTGELVWSYQHMANDQWDLDWAFERQITTIDYEGAPRKIVINVGKIAMMDALDARTGEYLFSVDTGTQNIISSIDPITGEKTYYPGIIPDPERECVVCPIAWGARSWPQTAYNPQTKMLYVPVSEWCMGMGPVGFQLLTSGVGLTSAPHPDTEDGMMARMQAINVETQQLAWTSDVEAPLTTGVLATAGGVVFCGDLDPSLKAFDDSTGEQLLELTLDDMPSSSLITYSIHDKQYIAVVVGFTNNHVRDTTRSYKEFLASMGKEPSAAPKGGAAIWVFAL